MALKSTKLFDSIDTSSASTDTSTSPLGYATNLNKDKAKSLLQSQEFLQDVMDFYGERDGKSFANANEAIDYFMSDRRWKSMNTMSMAGELMDTGMAPSDQNSRLARLQTTFEALPDFYEDGGDGWSGFATNAAAAILDPVNLIGFGIGGAGAKAAAAGVRATAGPALTKAGMEVVKRQALKEGVKAGAKKGAMSEGALEMGISGTQDVITQNRDVNLGIQDEVSLGQAGIAAVTGGVLGGGLGGVFGAAGAVAPNPFKGGSNAITQGIKQGQQLVKEDAAMARIAEAELANSTTPEEPLTTAQQDTQRKQELSARIEERASRLEAARMDEVADATNVGDKVNVDINVDSTEVSQAARIRRAVSTMNDSDRIANKLDLDAESASDPAKAMELRKQAQDLRTASNNIEAQLNKLDSAEVDTTEDDILMLEDLSVKAETLRLPAPENVSRPTVNDAAGNEGSVMMPDGSVSSPTEVQNQTAPFRTDADANVQTAEGAIPMRNETSTVEQVVQDEVQVGQEPGTTREDIVRERQLDTEITTASEEIASIDASLAESNQMLKSATTDEERQTIQEAINSSLGRREEVSAGLERATQERDAIQNARKASATTTANGTAPTPEQMAAIQQEAQAAVDDITAEELPDVQVEDFEDITPEAIAEELSTNLGDLLEVLDSLGFNTVYEQRVLKQLGDGRTKEGRAARREYLIDRLKYARSREVLRGTMSMLEGRNKFDRLVVEAMVEASTEDAVEVAHAMSIYDRYVVTRSYQIFIDKLAELGPVANPKQVISDLRAQYGDVVADSIENSVNSASQEARFSRKDMKDLERTLPADKVEAINQIMGTYAAKINQSYGKPAEQAHLDTVRDRLVIKYAFSNEEGVMNLTKYEAWGAGKVEDIDLAPHIGSQRRQGLGKYNANGKIVKGGDMVKRAQKMLQQANKFGYHGKLIDRMVTRDADGNARRVGGVATAMEELADAAIARASKARMVTDEIKRTESIETAKRDIDNPEWLEDKIKAHRKATGKIARLEKKKDGFTADDEEAMIALEAKISEASSELAALDNELSSYFTDGVAGARDRLSMLTKSAEKEAAGRKKEQMMERKAVIIVRETLMPRLKEVRGKLFRHSKAIEKGVKSDLSDQEASNLTQELADIMAQWEKAYENVPAAERKAMAEMKKRLRQEYVANGYISKRAKDEAPAWSEEEIAQMEALFGPAEAEDFVVARDMVEAEMRQEAAQSQLKSEINTAVSNADLNKMTNAELRQMIMDLQAKSSAKATASSEPAAVPAGLKFKPRVRVTKDGIEIDVNNDFKYLDAGDGTTKVEFNGESLASIRKSADGFILRSLTSNAPAMLFESKSDLVDYLPTAFRKRIKAANENHPRFDSYEGQDGLEYGIPDWTKSETYGEYAQVEIKAETRDPVDQPQVIGDESNVLSMTADNFDIPANKQLAVQIIDPASGKMFKSVRVASYKSVQSIGDILKKSSKYEYVVGTVDAPNKSGSLAAEESFRPLNEDELFYPVNAKEPITGSEYQPIKGKNDRSSKRVRKNRPTKIEDIANKQIADELPPILQSTGIQSVGDLIDYQAALENISWAKLAENGMDGFKQFIEVRKAVGVAMKRYAPNGIDKPTTTKATAVKNLREVMAGFADDEVQSAEDFLMRLAGNMNGTAPIIKGGERTSYSQNATSIAPENRNRIVLGDNSLKVDADGKRHTPATADLVHELGHWVYENALDEADKLEFWQAMGKYIDDGSVNIDMLTKRTADTQVYSNSLESPAELFANQFQAWAISNGQINDMNLWKKVARMATALIKKIKGETFEIDPDLVPIFQRHLPVLDIDPVTGATTDGISRFAHLEEFGRKVGKKGGEGAAMAGKQMRVLDERIIELQSAINTSTPEATDSLGIIMTLEKIQKEIYGEYGGKMGATNHKKYKDQEGSGSTRITFLDGNKGGRDAVDAMMKSQYQIHEFLSALRAAGAYRTSNGNVIADIPDQEGLGVIADAIIENLSADGGNAFDAQLAALRQNKSSYDALSQDVVIELRRMSNDLILAMEKAQKEYKAAFIRNMPRDERMGSLAIDDNGYAFLRTPSKKSVRYMRKARAEAEKEIEGFINMNLLVEAMNEADVSIFLDEIAVADIDMAPAVSMMSREEIAAEASVTPRDNKRFIDLSNEMRNRSNTEQQSIEEVMADLSDEQLEVMSYIHDVDTAKRVLKAAIENGDQTFIRIATHYLQTNGVDAPISPKTKEVNAAIEKLNDAAVGTDTANGVRHGVPTSVKDHLAGLTNRDKRVEFIQRDLATRAFTLINKMDEDSYITDQDIVRLLRGPEAATDSDSVAVINGDEYNAFRTKMRSLAAALAKGDRNAIVGLVDLAVNAGTREGAELVQPAIDITGMSMNDMVTEYLITGTVDFAGFADEIPRRSQIMRAIKNTAERAVFLGNGLLENGSDKGVMFAAHGDMFSAHRKATPALSASRAVDTMNMHPSIAIRAAREFINAMPKRVETAVREFLGVNHAENLDDHLFFNTSENANVRGVTYTDEGAYGSGVYLTKKSKLDANYDAAAFIDEMNELVELSPISADDADVAREAIKAIAALRTRIAKGGPDLAHSLRIEARQWRMLKDLVPLARTNKVAPVFAAIEQPFKINTSTKYTLLGSGSNNIGYLLQKAAHAELFTAKGAEVLRDSLPAEFTGLDLYRILTDENGVMVSHGSSADSVDAKASFSKLLEDEGFDGLETDDGFVMFDETSVREINRPFKESDTKSYLKEQTGGDLGIAGEAAIHMATTGEKIDQNNFIGLTVQAQMAGVPDAALKPFKRIAKGRELGSSDIERVSKFSSVMNYFTENSQRFRNMGATWFGNKIKPKKGTGVFESHDVELANTLNSILIGDTDKSPSLRNLSDTKTGLKRWMQRNRGLLFSQIEQPESHRRILDALRRGKGAVAGLKPEERAVAYNIAKAFEKELQRMRDLGISVGDTRQYGLDFYVPQVWDKEAMLANPNAFKKALTNFFIREQRRPGYDGKIETIDALQAKADKLFHKMAESDEGVLDVMGDSVKNAVSDPMYRRMLVLKPEDFPELEGFLVNDLEGLLVKYFDRTTRKRVLTKEFGLNGHGIEAYKAVVHLGSDAAVDILMRDKMQVLESETVIGKVGVENTVIPRIVGSREDVAKLVQEVKRTLGETAAERARNKQAAMAVLINAQDPASRNSAQYLARVEAIVNALADFPQGGAPKSLMTKIDEFTNVLNKRPVDGTHGNEVQHKVSRSLRAFNSVSLLGYTTLSSLPDVALPLIRSGNMGAFAKAWKGYMSDPQYRRFAKNIGTGIENMMHDRMVQMAGEGSQRFTNAFFNATGLTPWTNAMREVASMVGVESFKAEIARAIKMRASGNTNSSGYRTAVRFLERYGLTGEGAEHDFLRSGSFRLDAIPDGNEAVQNQVRAAILRFTNEAIFTPNPNDVPMWAQTPVGALMFQLKSFPLMMARLSKDVLSEARQGNFKPLVYMATAGVGMGAGAIALKDIVQARGGDDDQSAELRNRNLSNILEGFGGSEEETQRILRALGFTGGTTEDADKAIGWWIEGLLAMGGLGLFAELLYNSAAQVDNGAYGYARFMSNVLGPSFGLTKSAFDIAGGLTDASESNSKERTAMREIAGRIPMVGGFRPLKEGIVDAVAGKKQEKGNPWSDSWGKGNW